MKYGTNFKKLIGPSEPVIINRGAPRDLLPAQITWKLGNRQKKYSVYDLPNIQLAFLVNDVQSAIKRLKELKTCFISCSPAPDGRGSRPRSRGS